MSSKASQSARALGPSDAELDLSGLGTALWRKRWWIILPTLLIALATFAVVHFITPRYLSESRVLIVSRENIYLRLDADKDGADRTVDQEAVTSQAQLILSRDLASDVISRLKLGELPEFDPGLAPRSPIKTVLGALGIIKNPMRMTPQERVLESYYDRLTVFPVEKSRVIVIDFLSENPELAARVANTIADEYLEMQRKAKQEQAQSAGRWLAGEIDSMRKKVVEAEGKVEAYRAKSNLLVGSNNTTLSAQQLSDMATQLAAARAQRADAEAKAKLIRDMLKSGQPIESSDILNSELLRRLSEQRVTLRAQLAEQSSSLLDNHPRIKELKAQIADLDHQITNEAATIARSLENDAKIAGARVDSLTASLDQLKTQAATTNADDVQLRELERDAKSQRDLLESYLAKYREATSRDTINATPADARVISRATVSTVPAYPKKIPAVLIATLTTLVLTSGIVLTRALLAAPVGVVAVQEPARYELMRYVLAGYEPTQYEPIQGETSPSRLLAAREGVRRRLEPTLEPELPLQPVAVAGGSVAEIARTLRQDGEAGRRIAVFGAIRGMDASFAALKLARNLADDSRVVLVGLGPADGAIRAASNEPAALGLAELCLGSASFRDILTKDVASHLHLISSGHTPADRDAILASAQLATVFDALARSYDHIIVAAGTIVGPELETIGQITPRAVLVAETLRDGKTASAGERLIAAGFEEVTVLIDTPDDARTPEAAAA
jgi:uncharacterized protein involved in exopolysaccharide biosynthesis/Mrp family chromosome partitioning ATPase